jgi:hypothetical protein
MPQNIPSVDETALFHIAHPIKQWQLRWKHVMDKSKKLGKPHCMKNMCLYECKASQNARVTVKIFNLWLPCFGSRITCKNRNILLLLDQCAAHNFEGL